MKRQGVFLLPLDGMPVYRRVTPIIVPPTSKVVFLLGSNVDERKHELFTGNCLVDNTRVLVTLAISSPVMELFASLRRQILAKLKAETTGCEAAHHNCF